MTIITTCCLQKQSLSLFTDESESETEVDFSVRPQFEGSKGQKVSSNSVMAITLHPHDVYIILLCLPDKCLEQHYSDCMYFFYSTASLA